MKELQIFINGCEDFRISYLDKNNIMYCVSTGYLGDDPDWSYMAEVDRETFKECLKKVNWIPNGWSQKLKEEYQAVLDFLRETEK